jgi:hypothetical protein
MLINIFIFYEGIYLSLKVLLLLGNNLISWRDKEKNNFFKEM